MTNAIPMGPYKLITVNTAPERAAKLIGRVADELKNEYTINHVKNCESIDQVESAVKEYRPDLLFCASMWTCEEAAEIQSIAKRVRPNIITHALPQGLQVQQGPDAVVDHLKFTVPQILRQNLGDNA